MDFVVPFFFFPPAARRQITVASPLEEKKKKKKNVPAKLRWEIKSGEVTGEVIRLYLKTSEGSRKHDSH